MKKKKFKGFGWTELSERWGINIHNNRDDSEVLEETKQYIQDSRNNKDEMTKVASDIREYLEALIVETKKWEYSYYIWQGLIKIPRDGDETLLMFTIELLGSMWS